MWLITYQEYVDDKPVGPPRTTVESDNVVQWFYTHNNRSNNYHVAILLAVWVAAERDRP